MCKRESVGLSLFTYGERFIFRAIVLIVIYLIILYNMTWERRDTL